MKIYRNGGYGNGHYVQRYFNKIKSAYWQKKNTTFGTVNH